MSRNFLLTALWMGALLSACQPVPAMEAAPSPAARPTELSSPTATSTPELTSTPVPASRARRVIILSIDGLRPDAIPLAPMLTLRGMMQNGAYSLTAQTIQPSATLPAHTSMLSGQCPDKHGVDWNDYMPELGYAPVSDLFDIAHAAGLQTVMYVGKEKMLHITEPRSVDIFVYINDRDLVITQNLIENFPSDFRLMFLHYPTPDWMGHEYGWLSGEQLSVIFRADQALSNLMNELEARGLREETLVIVTADHGGHDTTHGTDLPEDMTIPWIAFGAGIQPGALTSGITTTDTAATAAFALDLPIPAEWDGVPVYEAFGLPVVEESRGCVYD